MTRDEFYQYLTELDPQLVRVGTIGAYDAWADSDYSQDVPSIVWLWSEDGMATFRRTVENYTDNLLPDAEA